MNRINKSDLIERVRNLPFGLSATSAQTVIDTLLGAIQDEVAAGNTVTLRGFGTFILRERDARIGRNPRTGAEMEIPASSSMAFKAAKVGA